MAGANGVFAEAAGQFPSDSWQSSNYFVDGVVRLPGSPQRIPQVSSVTPLDGATGVGVGTSVTATFSVALDHSTVNGASFTLVDSAGDPVAASVSYDESTQRATLVPAAPLARGGVYTARLGTGIRSDDETPLPSPYAWTFTTEADEAPQVTARSPVDGATDISPLTRGERRLLAAARPRHARFVELQARGSRRSRRAGHARATTPPRARPRSRRARR